MTPLLEALTQKELELQGEDYISDFLAGMETPQEMQLHVLVVSSRYVHPGMYIEVKEETYNTAILDELRYYQKRGELIQRNCKSYCRQIMTKIDELYARSESTLPFIAWKGHLEWERRSWRLL